jgi:hypothetical protein
MDRCLTYSWPSSGKRPTTYIEFYREEFLKHQRCLQRQREYYSERAVRNVETALDRLLTHLDQFCSHQDADQVLSGLLKKIDGVTGLSAWSEPKKVN